VKTLLGTFSIMAVLFTFTITAAMGQEIPISGKVSRSGDTYTITTKDGMKLETNASNIVSKGGKSYIKAGSELRQSIRKNDPACPNGGPTFCAGAVEMCCGNGHVLRACFGVWGCP
jgi:hypothetical protein